MKVLKSFTFTDTRARIHYKPEWFSGDCVELNEQDLGPYTEKGPGAKLQSLKKHAWDNYGKLVRGQATDKNTLVIQAYDPPKETK